MRACYPLLKRLTRLSGELADAFLKHKGIAFHRRSTKLCSAALGQNATAFRQLQAQLHMYLAQHSPDFVSTWLRGFCRHWMLCGILSLQSIYNLEHYYITESTLQRHCRPGQLQSPGPSPKVSNQTHEILH